MLLRKKCLSSYSSNIQIDENKISGRGKCYWGNQNREWREKCKECSGKLSDGYELWSLSRM